VQNLFVYVKARIQERYNQPGRLELKIQKMELLENVKESAFSNLKLKMELESITEQFINQLDQVLGSYQGKCNVEFYVEDKKENMNVKLFSKKSKIAISEELINELNKFPNLEYELN
jgi:DNA polymerase-3 subunit alpha